MDENSYPRKLPLVEAVATFINRLAVNNILASLVIGCFKTTRDATYKERFAGWFFSPVGVACSAAGAAIQAAFSYRTVKRETAALSELIDEHGAAMQVFKHEGIRMRPVGETIPTTHVARLEEQAAAEHGPHEAAR